MNLSLWIFLIHLFYVFNARDLHLALARPLCVSNVAGLLKSGAEPHGGCCMPDRLGSSPKGSEWQTRQGGQSPHTMLGCCRSPSKKLNLLLVKQEIWGESKKLKSKDPTQ